MKNNMSLLILGKYCSSTNEKLSRAADRWLCTLSQGAQITLSVTCCCCFCLPSRGVSIINLVLSLIACVLQIYNPVPMTSSISSSSRVQMIGSISWMDEYWVLLLLHTGKWRSNRWVSKSPGLGDNASPW